MFSVPSTVQHLASKCSTPFLTVILVNGGWKSPRLSTLLVHPNGHAAKSTGLDIGVVFGPQATRPDYCGIAIAAAGGPTKAWAKRVISGSAEMEAVFAEGVAAVQGGRTATIEVVIPDLDAK